MTTARAIVRACYYTRPFLIGKMIFKIDIHFMSV